MGDVVLIWSSADAYALAEALARHPSVVVKQSDTAEVIDLAVYRRR